MDRASISTVLAGAALLAGCPEHVTPVAKDRVQPMQQQDDMQAVRNDRIQFATMRPPGSTLPTLDRQVVLTGPPEVVALAGRGDEKVLGELVALLGDPERAWAAEVVLAALTGREADIVNSFAARPAAFWPDVGQGAKDRWRAWLDGARGRLQWDAGRRQFVER